MTDQSTRLSQCSLVTTFFIVTDPYLWKRLSVDRFNSVFGCVRPNSVTIYCNWIDSFFLNLELLINDFLCKEFKFCNLGIYFDPLSFKCLLASLIRYSIIDDESLTSNWICFMVSLNLYTTPINVLLSIKLSLISANPC